MTSLHSSLRRRHGLEKDDLAHHRIVLGYPRFIDDYLPSLPSYVKKLRLVFVVYGVICSPLSLSPLLDWNITEALSRLFRHRSATVFFCTSTMILIRRRVLACFKSQLQP